MNKTRVIYLTSNYDFEDKSYEDINNLYDTDKQELLHWAENTNNEDVEVYSLQEFQYLFNHEYISDLGYIYFVEEE